MNRYCPNCLKKNHFESDNCLKCENSLLLNNKYYLIDVLGENSGTTYLAVREDLCISPRQFIIKELSIKKVKKWKEEELFKRERNILKNLDHKFIPKTIDEFDIKSGKRISYYTVMEYINNDYDYKNKPKTKIEEEKVLNYILKLADILDYTHSFTPPIIHRDIKLSNIIMKEDDIYLIDFGSATNIVQEEGGSTIAGTFGYMAPEQFLGKAFPATDYYALGVLALVMLSNKEPEEFLNKHEVNWEKLNISIKMKEIISKLLVYDYEKRVSSKEDLLSLVTPVAIENQFNIIKFLTEYNKIIKSYETSTRIDLTDYSSMLLGSIIAFSVFLVFNTAIGAGVVLLLFFIIFIRGTFKKEERFAKRKIKEYLRLKDNDLELKISVMSSFYKYDDTRNMCDTIFYEQLNEKLLSSLDMEKLFKYNEIIKTNQDIKRHIENTERFRTPYIKALKLKLTDKNNSNFKISDEEIKELINDTEKKDIIKRKRWDN